MGRPKRAARGGIIYHVLNRANARLTIFEKDRDYEAFERVIEEAVEKYGTRLLSYCLMPNHWHLVLWPNEDGELSRFTGWLTLTHTQRWHAHRGTTGSGHVYQGRFKSFPVQDDEHFYTVCRYVERNALKANLVESAEHWRWSSLYLWHTGSALEKQLLAKWPIPRGSVPLYPLLHSRGSMAVAGGWHGSPVSAPVGTVLAASPFILPPFRKFSVYPLSEYWRSIYFCFSRCEPPQGCENQEFWKLFILESSLSGFLVDESCLGR